MKKLPDNILQLPMEERALMALKEAVEGVIEENARLGLPMSIWRDGEIAQLSPDEVRGLARSTQCR